MTLSKVILAVAFSAMNLFSAGPSPVLVWQSDAHLTSYDPADKIVPGWSGGALIAIEANDTGTPIIREFDASGAQFAALQFSIAGARTVAITGYARSDDGTVALCGILNAEDGRASAFVATIATDTRKIKLTHVEPYQPRRLAAASDGTIWTIGLVYSDDNNASPVLRHFSKDGVSLEGHLPQTSVDGSMLRDPGHLAAGGDRIGWYSGPRRGSSAKYGEVQGNGTVTWFPGIEVGARVEITGLAITANGSAFVSAFDPDSKTHTLYQLNRTARHWDLIRVPLDEGDSWGRLLGSSNSGLVVVGKDRFTYKFYKIQ